MRSLRITNIIKSEEGVRWHRVCGLLGITAVASLLSVKLLLAVYAMAGDLDPSFGNGGNVVGSFFDYNVADLAIQPDGKLLAVGPTGPGCSQSGGAQTNFKLLRLLTNGNLDTSFGSGGSAVLDFGGDDSATVVAIQPDGKILVAGSVLSCTSSYFEAALIRYTANGSLDSSFGTDGKMHIASVTVDAIALQPDGKIILVGRKRWTHDHALIACFNPDGSTDYSFDGDGMLTTDVWGVADDPGFHRVLLQNDGKIVVLSQSPQMILSSQYRLLRYSSTGQLDSSFGSSGVFISTPFESGNDTLLQADGKIVVAGGFQGGQFNWYGALFRHNTDGSLDPNFTHGGPAYGGSSHWFAITQQENGRLVVAGDSGVSGGQAMLSRYHTDGLLDTSFGTNGQVVTGPSTGSSKFYEALMQGDGRIVAAGYVSSGSNLIPMVNRFLNDDGTPAPADVRVSSATISPRTVYPGNFVTYTIPVTNYGPGKAAHLTFTAKIPANTVFYSFSAAPGWVVYQQPSTGGTSDVSCSAYELPAGSTVNFTLTVRVSPVVPSGTQINQISSIKSFMSDPNIFNNTWTKSFTVQ